MDASLTGKPVVETFEAITVAALQSTICQAQIQHGWDRTPLNPARSDESNLVVLVEEVGEVANAMTYDEGSQNKLQRELFQVAAMALSWAQAIDLRHP